MYTSSHATTTNRNCSLVLSQEEPVDRPTNDFRKDTVNFQGKGGISTNRDISNESVA
jgi:hypothetical protein